MKTYTADGAHFGDVMAKSEAPDPRQINKKYLLNIIMEKYGITDEDLKSVEIVKSKVRENRIDSIVDHKK